ncbi:MAG: hypothetical protein ACYTEQ_01765 [Planctomycetota bacterium]|jgi:hypothetical protein
MLSFKEETHEYALDGRHIPSVTDIIGEWQKVGHDMVSVFTGRSVPVEKFLDAADHGTAVHKACAMYAQDIPVDLKALHPDVHRALMLFSEWFEQEVEGVLFCEQPVYHRNLWFAGTPDLIVKLKRRKRLAVVDIKTGAFEMAGPQLAAYRVGAEFLDYGSLHNLYVLHIPKDSLGVRFKKVKEFDVHWDFFKARLLQYRYLRRVK